MDLDPTTEEEEQRLEDHKKAKDAMCFIIGSTLVDTDVAHRDRCWNQGWHSHRILESDRRGKHSLRRWQAQEEGTYFYGLG